MRFRLEVFDSCRVRFARRVAGRDLMDVWTMSLDFECAGECDFCVM